jgi:hypothetical protein
MLDASGGILCVLSAGPARGMRELSLIFTAVYTIFLSMVSVGIGSRSGRSFQGTLRTGLWNLLFLPVQTENGRLNIMRKWLGVLLVVLFLSGCGAAAKESEFWQHDSVYKNNDHMYFSWWEFKKPTERTGMLSDQQKWWGVPVEAPF